MPKIAWGMERVITRDSGQLTLTAGSSAESCGQSMQARARVKLQRAIQKYVGVELWFFLFVNPKFRFIRLLHRCSIGHFPTHLMSTGQARGFHRFKNKRKMKGLFPIRFGPRVHEVRARSQNTMKQYGCSRSECPEMYWCFCRNVTGQPTCFL